MSVDPLQKFRDALEEPAPPDPPAPVEDGGDGDDGYYVLHCTCPRPLVSVLDDGSVKTRGWPGSLLIGWYWIASAVAAYVLASAAWGWLAVPNLLMALAIVLMSVGLGMGLALVWALAEQGWRRLRARRAVGKAVQP